MTTEKQAIREQSRAIRAAITPDERKRLSGSAAGRLAALPEAMSARLVAGYLPTAEEIDPTPALRTLAALGAQIAYPRIAGPGALTLHLIENEHDLETGRFGIRQPKVASPCVDPEKVDMLVVPGVAFDTTGRRLGYGGGYYDRLLSRTPAALRVGIAFESQLYSEIPHEEHDLPMNVLVTPERVIRI